MGITDSLPRAEREFLLQLQINALQYFLDNQMPCGLVLDRQRNHGPRRSHGLCSTATTGMGLFALALSAQAPYHLLTPSAAAERIRATLLAALERLPEDYGIMPHFVHSATQRVHGNDRLSTIDSSWLVAGGLWSAALLQDSELEALAFKLYERIDWRYWSPDLGDGRRLLRHGMGANGQFLGSCWDRLNGETIFMYVMAAGASDDRSITPDWWLALEPFYGTVADLRFNNADLGLFVFQYGLDLLDLTTPSAACPIDLWAEARVATTANYHACRRAADRFVTYRRFWGVSAGDGPGEPPSDDAYRCYTPAEELDGTAHLSATLAAIAHAPEIVLENLRSAQAESGMGARGRYGFSNINIDRAWIGRDMIGIDAGAAVLALDNFLNDNRIRTLFHQLPCVRQGLERLGLLKQQNHALNDMPVRPTSERLAS
jgi:hypothetical protein